MPRVRRQRHARHPTLDWAELSIGDKLTLSTGLPSDRRFSHLDRIQDAGTFREAWGVNAEKLLDDTEPGTRPAGWWLLDAPEGRRRMTDEPGLDETTRHSPGGGWYQGWAFEPSLMFLVRLGLLFPGELDRLRRSIDCERLGLALDWHRRPKVHPLMPWELATAAVGAGTTDILSADEHSAAEPWLRQLEGHANA